MRISSCCLQNRHTMYFLLRKNLNTNMFRFVAFADDFFNRLERSRSSKLAAKSVPIPEPSIGDKAKGKQPMEGDLSLRTPPTRRMKSHARCEHGVTSSKGGLETESSEEPVPSPAKRNPTEVPKGPLEDSVVPPTRTPYDEGSFNSSGSFPWITDLNVMLDEIWSEKSFQELTNEPLQAGNREGMRMLSMVRLFTFSSKIFKS